MGVFAENSESGLNFRKSKKNKFRQTRDSSLKVKESTPDEFTMIWRLNSPIFSLQMVPERPPEQAADRMAIKSGLH